MSVSGGGGEATFLDIYLLHMRPGGPSHVSGNHYKLHDTPLSPHPEHQPDVTNYGHFRDRDMWGIEN